jgi:hypothetical protein
MWGSGRSLGLPLHLHRCIAASPPKHAQHSRCSQHPCASVPRQRSAYTRATRRYTVLQDMCTAQVLPSNGRHYYSSVDRDGRFDKNCSGPLIPGGARHDGGRSTVCVWVFLGYVWVFGLGHETHAKLSVQQMNERPNRHPNPKKNRDPPSQHHHANATRRPPTNTTTTASASTRE